MQENSGGAYSRQVLPPFIVSHIIKGLLPRQSFPCNCPHNWKNSNKIHPLALEQVHHQEFHERHEHKTNGDSEFRLGFHSISTKVSSVKDRENRQVNIEEHTPGRFSRPETQHIRYTTTIEIEKSK
jgi:hypothetical protein